MTGLISGRMIETTWEGTNVASRGTAEGRSMDEAWRTAHSRAASSLGKRCTTVQSEAVSAADWRQNGLPGRKGSAKESKPGRRPKSVFPRGSAKWPKKGFDDVRKKNSRWESNHRGGAVPCTQIRGRCCQGEVGNCCCEQTQVAGTPSEMTRPPEGPAWEEKRRRRTLPSGKAPSSKPV